MSNFSEAFVISDLIGLPDQYIEVSPSDSSEEHSHQVPMLLSVPGVPTLRRVEGQAPYAVSSGGNPSEVVDKTSDHT
tara:strand:- start:53942 stop:54172 length:231 start_codon:yes stop_codon:yes gene_type:complete